MYCVKFVHKEIFSTVYLNEEALAKYPAKQLALASTLLRTKGFASKAKSDADDMILAYCTRKNISQYTTSEVPTREEPSTPILHSSDFEEGEVGL